MSEQETQLKGPKKFEDCHVCGHQPQHEQFMAPVKLPGMPLPNPGETELRHRYVCTYCNEGTDSHDSKAYAGLNWNGKHLRKKAAAQEKPDLTDAILKRLKEVGAEDAERWRTFFDTPQPDLKLTDI